MAVSLAKFASNLIENVTLAIKSCFYVQSWPLVIASLLLGIVRVFIIFTETIVLSSVKTIKHWNWKISVGLLCIHCSVMPCPVLL